jgi:regulator of protease activity HflC (stomatin/prohibitin superfamily)
MKGHDTFAICSLVTIILLILVMVIFNSIKTRLVKVTIYEYQKGLRYRDGKFIGLLDPGAYWIYSRVTAVVPVDMRTRFVSIASQEILTKDAVTVKMSLAVQYAIEDPDRAINGVEKYYDGIHLALQIALRDIVSSLAIDELLEGRNGISGRLMEMTSEKIKALGIRLESVDIKDITLPGDLKKIFAQVVTARKEGQAALEKARGETAALRSLANVAQLLEKNPALLNLRVIQTLEGSKGNTVVMGGFPPGIVPLPARPGRAAGDQESHGDEI